jgi:hypothetical protein
MKECPETLHTFHAPAEGLGAAKCVWCDEPFAPGDKITSVPTLGPTGPARSYYHSECFVRSFAGSVAHQNKECSCFGGWGEDDPTLTPREAARAAYYRLLGFAE